MIQTSILLHVLVLNCSYYKSDGVPCVTPTNFTLFNVWALLTNYANIVDSSICTLITLSRIKCPLRKDYKFELNWNVLMPQRFCSICPKFEHLANITLAEIFWQIFWSVIAIVKCLPFVYIYLQWFIISKAVDQYNWALKSCNLTRRNINAPLQMYWLRSLGCVRVWALRLKKVSIIMF